uniref:Uncharacterized protein n=1 Tax=Ixodes ricinus TaxID=34613 RepID=A0A6B0U937_IXORI
MFRKPSLQHAINAFWCTFAVHARATCRRCPGVTETRKFTLEAGQLKLLTVVLTPSATRLRLVRTGNVSSVVITATSSKQVVVVIVQRNLVLRK